MLVNEDDEPMPLPRAVPSLDVTRDDLTQEALGILLDARSVGRLPLILVALGLTPQAQQVLALQASLVGSLSVTRRRRSGQP